MIITLLITRVPAGAAAVDDAQLARAAPQLVLLLQTCQLLLLFRYNATDNAKLKLVGAKLPLGHCYILKKRNQPSLAALAVCRHIFPFNANSLSIREPAN